MSQEYKISPKQDRNIMGFQEQSDLDPCHFSQRIAMRINIYIYKKKTTKKNKNKKTTHTISLRMVKTLTLFYSEWSKLNRVFDA